MGHLDMVKRCIDSNCIININQENKQGMSALALSALKGHYHIVKLLLQHGAHIYSLSRNPIKLAMRSGFQDVVSLLQENSALSAISVSKSIDFVSSKVWLI